MWSPSPVLLLLVTHIEGGLLFSAGMTALPWLMKDQPPRGWTIAWIVAWPVMFAVFVTGVLCVVARRTNQLLSRVSVQIRR